MDVLVNHVATVHFKTDDDDGDDDEEEEEEHKIQFISKGNDHIIVIFTHNFHVTNSECWFFTLFFLFRYCCCSIVCIGLKGKRYIGRDNDMQLIHCGKKKKIEINNYILNKYFLSIWQTVNKHIFYCVHSFIAFNPLIQFNSLFFFLMKSAAF